MNTTMKHLLYVAAVFIAFLAFNINNLSAQDQPLDELDMEIKEWTQSCNQEIISLFENYLNSGSLTLAQLFDTFYIPIPDTEPPKYFSVPLIVENRHWGAVRMGYKKYKNN